MSRSTKIVVVATLLTTAFIGALAILAVFDVGQTVEYILLATLGVTGVLALRTWAAWVNA